MRDLSGATSKLLSFNKACTLVLAAHRARVFPETGDPPDEEGAGKIGSWPLPWPACNKKRRRQVPQVRPGDPDLPCAMVLRLIRALPGGPAVLPPSSPDDAPASSQNLASAPGCQNHTTSSSHQDRSSAR